MKNFYHFDPTSISDAVALLDKYGSSAQVIAGGTELLHEMKGYIKQDLPLYLVNLKNISGLDAISQDSQGLHVGPLAKLSNVASNTIVTGTWPALAQAAGSVATPEIRNLGTIGGNLCQEVWCWYFRREHDVFNCLRKGGAVCYASLGNNTYHSIFGGPKGCYAVAPSDTAVALSALGATVKTTQRTIGMNSFFLDTSPGNVLNADEIITDIVVPVPPNGATQVFSKVRVRESFDFAVASVGLMAAPTIETQNVTTANIYLGGVAPAPYEAKAAETALKGQTVTSAVAANVANAAVANAAPLGMNAYKVNIVKALVSRALLS